MSKFATTLSAAAVLFSSLCFASEEENREEKYIRFAHGMNMWGFTWEAHKVTTDDGYILTLFHLTGYQDEKDFVPRNADYHPILFKNCLYSDSASWFGNPDGYKVESMPARLFNEGFDVWLGDDRGNEYCQEHVSLTKHDPEFWLYSWAEIGKYDNTAYAEFVFDQTGKKVSYLGTSQSSNEMFYGLSTNEDRLAKVLYSVAQTDPCTIAISEGEHIYRDGLFHFQDYGIYNIAGPGWEKSVHTICSNFDSEICTWANKQRGAATSVQSQMHWAQNALSDRYQEFIPNELYRSGEQTESDLIALDSINQVPVAMFGGLLDRTCAHKKAVWTKNQIGERVTLFVTVPFAYHTWWGGHMVDPEYQMLKNFFIDPEQTDNRQE